MRAICLLCLVLATWPSALQAQRVDAMVIEKLGEALEDKKFASVQETVQEICDPSLEMARRGRTVAQRAESAAEAVHCINRWRGTLLALSADADTRARVRELMQPMLDERAEVKKEADAQSKFMGLNWGLGFGYSFGSDDAIDDAELVNGIVRVKSEKKQQPRALLEFHKFFWCNKDGDKEIGTRGCGPFLVVAAKDDKLLSGVGMGLMYGQKAKIGDSEGFSLGLGLILDGKVKSLADGFEKNEPAPAGETKVRFEEKARWSVLLFVTRTF